MSALTNPQLIPYPESSDPVNVHTDIQEMAQRVNDLFTALQIPYLPLAVRNESGAEIIEGAPVYIDGYLSGKPTVSKCDADNINTFPVIGVMKNTTQNTTEGVAVIVGLLDNIDTSDYSSGDKLYVASGGGLTSTKPSDGSSVVAIVVYSHESSGSIAVGPIKGGNGTWGSLKSGI